MRKNSAVVEQLKKRVLSVTMKAGKQIGTLTASLEQVQKKDDALKKEKVTATHKISELHDGKERADNEREGLVVKLQRTRRENEKSMDAVDRAQSNVVELQGRVRKDSDDLQRHMKEHWMNMCQLPGILLAERVVEAREDYIRYSCGVDASYVHRW